MLIYTCFGLPIYLINIYWRVAKNLVSLLTLWLQIWSLTTYYDVTYLSTRVCGFETWFFAIFAVVLWGFQIVKNNG